MDSSFQTRRHEFRSNGLLGLGLGWRQRNEEVVKRGGCARGETLLKAYTRKQKLIARSSAEAELNAAALGASEAMGVAVKPVLIIDANAAEHILRRHGI